MSKSKDIRSFFSVSPKTGAQKLSSKTNGISDTKKKKRRIIESDSDDEPSSPVVKKPKQNDEKKKPESSKYFSASASDIFGSDPVKRVSRSPAKKSKKSEMAIEDHDDAEFEAALLQLDVDSEWIDEKLSSKSKSKENGESSKPTRSPKNSTDSPSKSSTKNEECEIDESPPKKIKTSPPKSADKNRESKKDKSSLKRRPESPPKSVSKHEESKKDKFSSQKSDVSKKVESNKIHNKSESQSDVKQEVSNESSVKKSETINSPELKLKAKLQAFSKSKSDSDKVPDVKKVKTEEEKNSESKRTTPVVSPEKPKTASANKAAAISPEKSAAAISPEKPITASANKATAISPEKPRITSANKAAAISPEKPVTASANKVAAILPEKPKIANTNEASSNVVIDDQLWVEKYKPKSVKQIVGQQGPKSCVAKLTDWLKNWHSNHCGNKKLVRPSPWAKDDDGAYFKAALLSGRPGIGKTTTAHLVCKELGFDMVEFNASDTRSKKLLNQEVTELLSSKSLNPYFSGGHAVSSKHCLVMDEVDGMAGNEDRGGMQELIQLIKTSKVPIICMCNDKTSMKMRSLVNYCFDLPFSKPRIEQLRGALMSICFKEKLKMPKDVLDNIITNCEQDIRLILNHLSMLAANKLNDLEAIKKHVKLGPFEVVKRVFSAEDHKTMTIYDKSDLFFHDYSFAPLFVQENYLGVSPFIPGTAKKSKLMALFADAAESLSYGDLTEKILRSTNNWSLLPTQGMFASVIPGTILEGTITQRINFPAWLGKNSRRSKLDRFSQEIHQHTRLRVSGSKQAITLDYVLPLRDLILQPLIKKGSEGIPQTLAALQAYDLVKEDLESMLELCQWPNKMDPMSQVESKVKAALTRAYNKVGPSCPYAIPSVKKGSKNGGSNDQGELDEMGVDGDVAGVDDDEKDDDSDDGMIVVKKATAKKGGAVKATTSKASTSKTKARGGASRGGKRGKK